MMQQSIYRVWIGLLPFLFGFTPFTPVKNVCLNCEKPKGDLVTLTSGEKIQCSVLGQNSDYYILTRFNEIRAVEKTMVSRVAWKDGSPSKKLGQGDQVLLQNGLVLHGKITSEKADRYLMIQVGSFKHTVWFSQIKSAYKDGELVFPKKS